MSLVTQSALRLAVETFEKYTELHLAKGETGIEKALKNRKLKDLMLEALIQDQLETARNEAQIKYLINMSFIYGTILGACSVAILIVILHHIIG